MENIYIIKIDTKYGTDSIFVKTKPTHMDIGLIENHYLKAYDLENVHIYSKPMSVTEIPESVTHYIAQETKSPHTNMRYIDTIPYTEVFKPTHGYNFHDDKYSVFVPADELFAYRQGELIQDAMPSLNADDREFLMTGMVPELKGFNHLQFKEKRPTVRSALLTFGHRDEDNYDQFTISVVQNIGDGTGLYGHEDQNTYEVAMWFQNQEPMLPLTKYGDILGYQTPAQITKLMHQAQLNDFAWVTLLREIRKERVEADKSHEEACLQTGNKDANADDYIEANADDRDPLTGAQDKDIDPEYYQQFEK